ncbi:hypothetical protein KY285_037601 [Solanum tuberosum]|nr:hypothetical protein KY285_037601 [Solanum tuberosum]
MIHEILYMLQPWNFPTILIDKSFGFDNLVLLRATILLARPRTFACAIGSNKLQALYGEFETLCMQGGESVTDYFSRTLAIANKMRIHGERLEDVTIIEKILRSMTTKFNYIVCSIEESKDTDTLSLDELQGSLLVHEQKINQQDKDEVALKAAMSLKGTNQESVKWKGNNWHQKKEKSSTADSKEKEKRRDKSQIECYRCHQFRHYRSEYRTKLNRKSGGRSNFAEIKEDMETKGEEEVISLLMAYTAKEKASNDVWYLDTGCSNHMSGQKEAFSELDETFRDTVRFGDNSVVSAMGKGKDAESIEHESGDSQFNNERPQRNKGAPRWLENYEMPNPENYVIKQLSEDLGVFSQKPNPENDVIEQLSEELGLDTTQVKIWFYNKGYYIKAQQIMKEESEIDRLKNKIMYSENFQICLDLKEQFCAASNNPEQQRAILRDLLNEYAKFGEDVMMISKIIDHFIEYIEGYHMFFSEFEFKLDNLYNYKDPNGLDLELRLGLKSD